MTDPHPVVCRFPVNADVACDIRVFASDPGAGTVTHVIDVRPKLDNRKPVLTA